MTGMEHTIKQVRQAMQDAMNTYGPFSGTDQAQHIYDYLHALGLIAPAPLREEWETVIGDNATVVCDSLDEAQGYGGHVYRRLVSGWEEA